MGNLADEKLRLRLLTLASRGQTLIVGGEKSGTLTQEAADTFKVLTPLPNFCKLPPGKFDPNATSTFTQYQRIKLVIASDNVTVYAPVGYSGCQAAECLAVIWGQVKALSDVNSFMRQLCQNAAKVANTTPMNLWHYLNEAGFNTPNYDTCKTWLWLHQEEYIWLAEKPKGFIEVLGVLS